MEIAVEILAWIIITLWCTSSVSLFLFSAESFYLALHAGVKGRSCSAPDSNASLGSHSSDWPMVTVQLPVFNEKFVVGRLIAAVGELDYPSDCLEVQVLDDSTDETPDQVISALEPLQQKGLEVHHIRRNHRDGFKAGALANGMATAKGEFIAIFDADFVPQREFLKLAVPGFADQRIGAVQCRWDHLNRDQGLLTRMQAVALDFHFLSEQQGRFNMGWFNAFNGSAGVWRKSCISDSGGWQGDTVTEDLDLSVRAQLKGWSIDYRSDHVVSAELPADVRSVLSQQFRWSRGGAQTAVKLNGTLMRSAIGWWKKSHAIFMLNGQAAFFMLLVSALCSLMMTFLMKRADPRLIQTVGLISLGGMILFVTGHLITIYRATSSITGRINRMATLPFLLIFMMGLSWQQSRAIVGGWFGRKTVFNRTPKRGLSEMSFYKQAGTWTDGWPELGLGLLFLTISVISITKEQHTFLPFHLSMALGLLTTGLWTAIQTNHDRESTS